MKKENGIVAKPAIEQNDIDLGELGVEEVPGVGKKIAALLSRLGIMSVEDLLHHFPHRYIDLSRVVSISRVKVGEEVTVKGVIKDINKLKKRVDVLTVGLFDGTGYVYGVWFNQNYIADRLKIGMTAAFSGKAAFSYNRLQIQNPLYDVLGDGGEEETVHTGRIIPVHPATKSLSSTYLRRLIKRAIDRFINDIKDPLPPRLIAKYKFLSKAEAIKNIHFPEDEIAWARARKRLIFEEFFILETGLVFRKKRLERTAKGIRHRITGELLKRLASLLDWELTGDQKKAISEIRKDMAGGHPMHRLLQGEVGSGKTIVALAAMLMAAESGYQSAIMAPTEVLTEQHYIKLRPLIEQLGLSSVMVLGSMRAKEKKEALEKIGQGEADIAFGTHALIQEDVKFKRLGAAIIDEQHRFGVRQRLSLREKGEDPDILVMTATPIPRTVALTAFGDLDVSVLKELPGGRKIGEHVTTRFVEESRRQEVYRLILEEAGAGRQSYIVYPLIDESDKLQLKSVLKEAEKLKEDVFNNIKLGVIHSRLPYAEKDAVMRAFRDGELDVLFSTTVIEVGIDVPNATVIVIEHAERFGLSQLHQLRGRVGRGKFRSKCLLFGDLTTEEAKKRIEAIISIKDGFNLAETDLAIRGEGQLFGPRQSGLPDLRIGKLTRHAQILEKARSEAIDLVDADPDIGKESNRMLLKEIIKRFPKKAEWLFSG